METDTADRVANQTDPWSLLFSSSPTGKLLSLTFVVSLIVFKNVSISPVDIGRSPYKTSSLGSSPCLNDKIQRSSLQWYTCADLSKSTAAFTTHAVADSTGPIPSAITEREALTLMTGVRDCERSKLLWLTVYSPCPSLARPNEWGCSFLPNLERSLWRLPLLPSTGHSLHSACLDRPDLFLTVQLMPPSILFIGNSSIFFSSISATFPLQVAQTLNASHVLLAFFMFWN